MKKILTICAIIFATALAFTSCAKECFECQYPGQDQDGDGYPDNNGENGNDDGYNSYYYYVTKASSFQTVEVDIDGYCDGIGTEIWTVVTVFSDPIENTGQYSVVVQHKVTNDQFNFDGNAYYQTSIGSLDAYYACNWSGTFDLPYDELLSWWK